MRFFERVYALVSCIPSGRVATYGQIARLLDEPHAARTVGWAMRGLATGSDVPWHRVVSATGRISLRNPKGAAEQRLRLEAEGVIFLPGDRIDLKRFGWDGMPSHQVVALLARLEDKHD